MGGTPIRCQRAGYLCARNLGESRAYHYRHEPFYFDLEGEEPTGTSYAAPVVTGIVAQMMEEHSAKIGNPQAVKAKIMNTASPSLVSNANNGTESNPYLRDLSGAGMVNAVKAMSGTAYKYAWNHSALELNYITQFTVSLSAGQKIRATLAFTNKNTDVIIQNGTQYYDMNLRLVDAATGAVCLPPRKAGIMWRSSNIRPQMPARSMCRHASPPAFPACPRTGLWKSTAIEEGRTE